MLCNHKPMDIFSSLPANFLTLVLFGLIFLSVFVLLFRLRRTEYILYFLLVWFPLESVVLKYTPIEYYSIAKYLPEVFLYGLFAGSCIMYLLRKGRVLAESPLNKWFIAIVLVSVVSWILNQYSGAIWVLGLRQTLRFALVFFVVLHLQYEKSVVRRCLQIGLGVVLFEALLGTMQYLTGGVIDPWLFASDTIAVGGGALVGGAEQFWAPGTRVFATLGRYDRLGSLLALGLVLLFPYFLKYRDKFVSVWLAMGVLGLGLLLTRSRASWIAAFVGMVVIGVFILKDAWVKRMSLGLVAVVLLYTSIFAALGGQGTQVVDQPNQNLSERILEAVSLRSWRESYEGYGRIFFIINTPRHLFHVAPFFGMGAGNFGGGVASSLVNTTAYEKLKLPFGIQNQFGQIDNSWFSILGELGIFGLLVWLCLFGSLARLAFFVYKKESDLSLLALGLCGATIGIAIMGFFGPYFEFRTLMYYFWLTVGLVLLDYQKENKKGNLLE